MRELQGIARFKFDDGKLEEFKRFPLSRAPTSERSWPVAPIRLFTPFQSM